MGSMTVTKLLPAHWTGAVQLQPGHNTASVVTVLTLQLPHLLTLGEILKEKNVDIYCQVQVARIIYLPPNRLNMTGFSPFAVC